MPNYAASKKKRRRYYESRRNRKKSTSSRCYKKTSCRNKRSLRNLSLNAWRISKMLRNTPVYLRSKRKTDSVRSKHVRNANRYLWIVWLTQSSRRWTTKHKKRKWKSGNGKCKERWPSAKKKKSDLNASRMAMKLVRRTSSAKSKSVRSRESKRRRRTRIRHAYGLLTVKITWMRRREYMNVWKSSTMTLPTFCDSKWWRRRGRLQCISKWIAMSSFITKICCALSMINLGNTRGTVPLAVTLKVHPLRPLQLLMPELL